MIRKWFKSSQKTRFFVQCDHFRKNGFFFGPVFPVPLQKLGGVLKHINVRIELKLFKRLAAAFGYSIKAYQCSYRTETKTKMRGFGEGVRY